MTRAPQLSRCLVLEERLSSPDGAGGSSVTWSPLGMLWAEVAARSGREIFAAAKPHPRATYRIRVRGVPEGSPARPRPEQRLREGGRIFNILTVSEADPYGRFLSIEAEVGILP